MCLKCLMYRRRLMDAPRDGFIVFNVEDPRVKIAIPAHYVEGMIIQDVFTQSVTDLDARFELAALGMRFQIFRWTDVAFAVGRMLEHLAELIAISLGRLDLRWILNREEPRFVAVDVHLPGRAKGNDDVIALAELEVSKLGFHHSAAFMNPPGLIGLRVAVEIVHAFGYTRHTQDHVSIGQ